MKAAAILAAVFLSVSVAQAQTAEPVTEPSDTAAPIVFRWWDEKGQAHDTTDPDEIPPGVKRKVLDPHFQKIDVQKRRKWWMARSARLKAELHAVEDSREAAEVQLVEAVKNGKPESERIPLRKTIAGWKAEEVRLRQALQDLREEAKKKRIPEAWLQ